MTVQCEVALTEAETVTLKPASLPTQSWSLLAYARESEDFHNLRDHLDFIEANASWAWEWNITNLTGDSEWFKCPHSNPKPKSHHDIHPPRARNDTTVESKVEEHENEITQLKVQINGHYLNKERLEAIAGAWKKTCENLKIQIRELSINPEMTSHEENLTFMFRRVHGMFKEYEARLDRVGGLISRLLVDLEDARTKLKELVGVSERTKERSEAICNAVHELETPSEELRADYSMAKVTMARYLSRQGPWTYQLRSEDRETERKYGWDLAVQPYCRAVEVYEAKFGEMTSLVDVRYQSDEGARE